MEIKDIRPTALAGTWYSASPQQLRKEIKGYINAASPPKFSGEIIALIAPHAGHRYSGPVAGYAFRAIQGNRYETIAVVSPYHHGHHQPLLTSSHMAYSTPLGKISVDQKCLKKINQRLIEQIGHELTPISRDREHAIEIELPFLQVAVAGSFQLLPLMISSTDTETVRELGRAIGTALSGRRSLLIASTDLSHFYPEEAANQLDRAMLNAISTFNPEKVINVHRSGKGQACGLLPVLAVMFAAEHLGANQAFILNYATSGATSGDYTRVVGYGAGAFTRNSEEALVQTT